MRTASDTPDRKSTDLRHVVLSLENEEAGAPGRSDDSGRDEPDQYKLPRAITRRAVADITDWLNAAGVKWVACTHHDTDRHLHLRLHK